MAIKLNPSPHNQSGQVIIIALVFMAIMLTMSAALLGYVRLQIKGERLAVAGIQAQNLAEAGIDKAIYELNQNQAYAGETFNLSGGTIVVNMVTVDGVTKEIVSTGYVPNNANPVARKTLHIRTSSNSVTVNFNYALQAGDLGLTMNNSSTVEGNMFSNGNISGTGLITGDASVAAGTAPTADRFCSSSNTNYIFDDTDTTDRDLAQRFSPTVSGSLTRVQVYIKRNGNPGNLTLRVMPHNSLTNQPQFSGQIGGSGTFDNVTTSFGWVYVTFASPPSLTAGAIYWLVLDGSTNSASDYYTIAVDGAGGCGGNGKFASSYSTNPPNWQPIGGGSGSALNYKTFFGGTTTTLTGVTVQGHARAQAMSGCTVQLNAYYENGSTNCSVSGSKFPGTTAPAAVPMPIADSQITDWKDAAAAGGTIGTQNITGTVTLGPKKIVGDLNVSNYGIVYLTGALWVTGNITLSGNSEIIIDNSLGNNGTIIIADGVISVSNNVVLLGNNNPNSFPMLLGTATGNAIILNTAVQGGIFYTSAGTVQVSNSVHIYQLTGFGISLSNSATIVYDAGLQNASFATGPDGSWSVVPGSFVITPN